MNGLYDNLLMSYFGLKTFKTPNHAGIRDLSGLGNILYIRTNGDNTPSNEVEYSYDGSTWVSAGYTSSTPIEINIPANGKVFLRSSATKWANNINGVMHETRIYALHEYEVSGNLLSLLYGSSFTGNETTLNSNEKYVFSGLFATSTNLLSAENLVINAVGEHSHSSLFFGCTSLSKAPALSVNTLPEGCFDAMFSSCPINYIKCLATEMEPYGYSTNYWLYNVSPTGTFVKDASADSWVTGVSGIPEGWTVQNA